MASSLLGGGTGSSSSDSMNTALAFRRIYGINSSVTGNLAWSDENNLAYIAGHSLVMHDKKTKTQSFVNFAGAEISDTITTFVVGSLTAGSGR